jgi:hypothetical protein
MRLFATLLCLFLALHTAWAQLPNGSTAPNWTMADIGPAPNPPTTHTLYDYLDDGMGVIIDFSATWCGPCWNYHNSHAMRDLYNDHGPAATGEAMVFFIEGDGNTNENCLYGPSGCVGGTQGNWVAGTPYPIINNHTQNGAYQIAYYPTIYGVCPTNTVQSRKIYLLGQRNKAGLYDFISGCVTLTYDVTTVDVDCFGENDGEISVVAKSGVTPITYLWSNGATTPTISNLAPGSYTCTITDGNGDVEVSSPIIVNGPTEPVVVTALEVIPEHCTGNNGSIEIIANGGSGGYSYQWSPFGNTRKVQNLSGGNYSVTVTDNLGCVGVLEDIEVETVPFPEAYASADGFIDCTTPSILIDGSASTQGPGVSYLWSTVDGNIVEGENTLYPEVDQPGTYTLQVFDDVWGCMAEVDVQVAGNTDLPEASAGPDRNLPCGGGETTLQGEGDSGHPFQIQWTTQGGNIVSGQNTLNPLVDAAGTYILTILDQSNGCVRTDQVLVVESAEFSLEKAAASERCFGDNNGTATVNAVGAQGNVSYLWSNGANTQTIQNLSPGNYSVTVTDGSGCTNVTSVTIEPGIEINPTIAKGDESEEGANDGFIELNVPGGNVTYLWSNGASGSRIENLKAGTYTVTITDANGCTSVRSILVENASCLLVVSVGSTLDVPCHGGANGYAIINLVNDKGEAQFTWSDGGVGRERNDLTAGTYTVEVIDENNCPKTIEVTIDEPAPISLSVIQIPTFDCAVTNEELGVIEIGAEGGAGDFDFVWSHGDSSNIITVPYGRYTVAISDANGCVSMFEIQTLASDDEAPVAIGKSNTTTLSLGADGSISIPGQWLDGGSTDNCAIASYQIKESPLTCDHLGLQTVTLLVTDTNGNTAETEVEVRIIDDLSPVFECPRGIRVVSNNPIVNFDNPKATDNCAVDLYEQIGGPLSGSEFPYGITEVVFRALDESGNEAICRFNVQVIRPNRKVGFEEEQCACPPVAPQPLQGGDYAAMSRQGTAADARYIAAYPNPVSSQLTVEVSSDEMVDVEIQLMDLNGRVFRQVQRKDVSVERIMMDTEGMPGGLYLMQIRMGDCHYNKRIVIQK